MIEVPQKPIQGLHNLEDPNGSYWLLKAKLELLSYSKIDLESLEKGDKIPHPSGVKRRD